MPHHKTKGRRRTVGAEASREEEPHVRVRRRRGRLALHKFTQVFRQGYRVADDSLAVYELFVGVGAPPDFDGPGQPVATSATLPFSWTPSLPSSGNATYYLVVRLKDKYGLESFNVLSTVVTYAVTVGTVGSLSPPLGVAVYDETSGYVRVVSKYISSDDARPADTWEVYAKVGADPVVGVDPVAYSGLMGYQGLGETALSQVVGPYTPGASLHVLVVAKRTSDGARKAAAVVVKVLASSLDLVDGYLFGGTTVEQE